MLTKDDFDMITRKKYAALKHDARKKWGVDLPFDRLALQRWLWAAIGIQAKPCPYCSTPIDILSLQIDHKFAKAKYVTWIFDLANLQCICAGCNALKGKMSAESFALVAALRVKMAPQDWAELTSRLKVGSIHKRAHIAALAARKGPQPQRKRPTSTLDLIPGGF